MIYKVDGIKTLNERYHAPLGFARMLAEYVLFRRGPLTMAPSQLGLFTRSDGDQERANLQYHMQPLSLDQLRRAAAPVPRLHRERLQCAADQPRRSAAAFARIRPTAPAIKPNYLSTDEDRRIAAQRDPADAPYRGAAGAGAVSSRRISAGRRRARRRRSRLWSKPRAISAPPSFIRSAPRKWGLPAIRLMVVDERLRVVGLERLRVIDASVMPTHHVRQYQRADHDDRGKGRRHAARRRQRALHDRGHAAREGDPDRSGC